MALVSNIFEEFESTRFERKKFKNKKEVFDFIDEMTYTNNVHAMKKAAGSSKEVRTVFTIGEKERSELMYHIERIYKEYGKKKFIKFMNYALIDELTSKEKLEDFESRMLYM